MITEPTSGRLEIRLPHDWIAAIDADVAAQDTTKAEWLRRAIKRGISVERRKALSDPRSPGRPAASQDGV